MQYVQQDTIRDLNMDEIDAVSGGILPLIPIAIAFGKGFAVGGAIAGGVLTVADAFGIVDVF